MMKKKTILMACLAVMGILSVKAQVAMLALHHQGKATMFKSANVAAALNAAVNGDTIYLSSGVFASDFVITKKITLIGVGTETKVNSVSIAIPGSPTLTSKILQNLSVLNGMTIDKDVSGVEISQCRFNWINFNASTDNSVFDRCYIEWFVMSENIKSLQVVTSKIYEVQRNSAAPENTQFYNCNIKSLQNYPDYGSDQYYSNKAKYTNCVILSWNSYDTVNWSGSGSTFTNCLCGADYYKNFTYTGCWTNTKLKFDDELNASFTDNSTWDKYIGTDGTVVGCKGTSVPFSLAPSVPKVLEQKLEVNELGTELKVTLKVGTE